MNNLLHALHAFKPLWAPLLVPSLAAAGGLAMIFWGIVSIFAADSGFSW
jgi:hypothetical protein